VLERDVEVELVDGVDRLVETVTRWYLQHAPEGSLQESIEAGHEGFDALEDALEAANASHVRTVVDRLEALGVPETLAVAHALLPELALAPDVIAVAAETGRRLEEVGQAFALAGERLRLGWLESELEELPATQRVQRWAVQALRDDARRARRGLVARALAGAPGQPATEAFEVFIQANEARTEHLVSLMRSLSVDGSDLAGLMVVVRELRALTD
jgi:glutamate dehydrogenase